MRIVASLLFFMLLILGIFFLERPLEREVSPASFLPQDTLVYIEQQNGVQAVKQFMKSKLGKALGTINYVQVMEDIESDPGDVALVENTLSILKQLKEDKLVHEILGYKCSVALFAQRSWSKNAETVEQYLKDHILLISKPRLTAPALEALMSLYITDAAMDVVPYGEYSIKRFHVHEETISVAFVGDFVLAAMEERVLREAMDMYTSPTESLRTDAEFADNRKKFKKADRMLYFSVEGLQKLTEYGASQAETARAKAVLAELSSLKGVVSITYGAWRKGSTIQDKLFVQLNRATMDPLVGKMIDTAPSLNDTLPFISKDSLLYYWSNTLNVRLLWEMYVAEAGENNLGVANVQNGIQAITGYALEDLMDMVSSNVSILMKKSARAQFVPIPDLALMVKLNDPEKIGEILHQSLLDHDINIERREHKGIQYYYWGLYPQESLQPVYAIHRDYLILANTLDILKTIIDTPMNDSRLIASAGFKELDPGFQKLNNSVCYVNQATLVTHLEDLFSWAGTMLAIQDRHAAEKSKKIIDEFISPLFLGMAMYEKSATRTYIEDDRIIIETKTRIHK
jgi:hypothetical protein